MITISQRAFILNLIEAYLEYKISVWPTLTLNLDMDLRYDFLLT